MVAVRRRAVHHLLQAGACLRRCFTASAQAAPCRHPLTFRSPLQSVTIYSSVSINYCNTLTSRTWLSTGCSAVPPGR